MTTLWAHQKLYKFDEGIMIIFVSGKNRPLLLAKGVYWMSKGTKPRNYGDSDNLIVMNKCSRIVMEMEPSNRIMELHDLGAFHTTEQNENKPLSRKNISPRLSFLASVFNLYWLLFVSCLKITLREDYMKISSPVFYDIVNKYGPRK